MTDRSAAVAELVASLPEGVVATSPESLEKYRMDWAKDPDAGMPCAAVRAQSPEHVQVAVRWAASHGIPVVPRGAGTGLSGGASAIDAGLVISLERMTTIEIDPAARCAIVEPGAFNADVKKAAAEHGLWYPPDPSSFEICSIGGNVATNAGGLCCVKYGVTTDYVLGLDVVLADGRLITLGGKQIKDVAGLSLLKLFVGSEGTLGIVTRATLRLVPAQLAPSTLVATFDSVRAAADAVVAMGRLVRASMVELMDKPTVNQVEDFQPMGLDRDRALLLVQSDAPEGAREGEMAVIEKACRDAGAADVFVTHDPAEGASFVQARRLAFPAAEAAGALLLEDVGVEVPLLPELVARIEQVGADRGVDVVCVAHAGDGNTHPIVMYDAANADSTARARAAFEDILTAAIELGGTITGEHGVGRLKRDALPAMLGPDVMELNQRVKDALDPQGILNPGAVLAARS
ncbi:FAD-linked oxidase [Knoellia sinensis KCTC 19936]|uniref:FAD-linked oxidase n=1 Tax=Knoellia sinensis KCTC 19936 TaxID=1385520 RepID=A0A0A0J4J7_9MICO|nr:FAD-linked oxidase C-terminal domain-containing protein [Knoellia sinensis]KGN31669.1 FAD-linked oxidase [Knoellia sinensis KCTC 19936]